jgi:DNA-binding transcriptional regulator GbsR (MarR family)
MSENIDEVYKAFVDSDVPLKAGDVAEATGVGKTEVSKIIKILQKDRKITSPKRCFYAATGVCNPEGTKFLRVLK